MLTIKPSSSQSLDPDPALQQIDPANIIFVTDEPIKQPGDNIVQPYQMAQRTQGSQTGNTDDKRSAAEHQSNIHQIIDDQDQDQSQNNKFDTTNKALTDEFKKGLKDETTVKEQLLADESVLEKVSATESVKTITPEQTPVLSKIIDKNSEEEKNNIIELFNQLAEEKKIAEDQQSKQTVITQTKQDSMESIQKIESKKHRPIDVGLQNQSKLELLKDTHSHENSVPKKRKLSLQDLNLQQGFSEFVRKGNANFSTDGNADQDDEMGIKMRSYLTQVGKMHDNACKSYPDKFIIKHQDQVPPQDSIINIMIEPSGKVTLTRLQSSGNQIYDDYHMKVLGFMGDLPRIPKFIIGNDAVMPIKSIFYTASSLSTFGSYQPKKLAF